MKLYNYDGNTKEFTYESTASVNPKNPSEFLLPKNSTKVPIPKLDTFEAAIFDENTGVWSITEDHRGKTVWDIETKEESIVESIGPIPVTKTLLRPPKYGVWVVSAWDVDQAAAVEDVREKVIGDCDRKTFECKNEINGSQLSPIQIERYIDKYKIAQQFLLDGTGSTLLGPEAFVKGITETELATLIVSMGDAYEASLVKMNLRIEAFRIKASSLLDVGDTVATEALRERFKLLTLNTTDAEMLSILG